MTHFNCSELFRVYEKSWFQRSPISYSLVDVIIIANAMEATQRYIFLRMPRPSITITVLPLLLRHKNKNSWNTFSTTFFSFIWKLNLNWYRVYNVIYNACTAIQRNINFSTPSMISKLILKTWFFEELYKAY